MTDTQWLFELEGIYKLQEKSYDDKIAMAGLIKKGIINILGLNLMPVSEPLSEEEQALLDKFGDSGEENYRLRRATEDEFIPLALMTGREEIISEIIKKQKELIDQENADEAEVSGNVLTPEELDEIFDNNADVVVPDDMDVPEFITDPKDLAKFMKWKNSYGNDEVLAKSVEPLVEEDYEDESIFAKSNRDQKRGKSKVVITGMD